MKPPNVPEILEYRLLPVADITEGPNVRTELDQVELGNLAESLRNHGCLEPLRVYPAEEWDGWICVTGHRRLKAARVAGLAELPCLILTGKPSERARLIEQLSENLLRVDLKPVDRARNLRRLQEELNCSQRQLADRLGLAVSTVSDSLALLELSEDDLLAVQAGELPARAAVRSARRRKSVPEEPALPPRARFELRTPGAWTAVFTAPRTRATRYQMAGEAVALAEDLRHRLLTEERKAA